MAGNQVVLTFAGDDKNLSKTINQVGTGTKALEKNADRMGTSLDRAGESADNAETRFTGLASGIDGVTTLMASPSPQEFAQGIADVADGAANSLVPALKSAITSVGGLGKAMIGAAGIGGVAALGFAIHNHFSEQNRKAVENMAETFINLRRNLDTIPRESIEKLLEFGRFDDVFRKVIETSPQVGQELLEMGIAAGLSGDDLEKLETELYQAGAAEREMALRTNEAGEAMNAQAAAILNLRDANVALFDPIFGVISANQQLRDAEAAVTEAIAEHGRGSQEARDALLGLSEATVRQDSAVRTLASAVKNGDLTMGQAITRIQSMAGNSQHAAELTAFFKEQVRLLGGQINGLRDKTVNISVNTHFRQSGRTNAELLAGYAGGGIVPKYMATGGFSARGTDTVPAMLTPGEMVLNSQQQAELWRTANGRGGGGSPTVVINVSGSVLSERDLVRVVRDEMVRGGFRGALT